SPQRVAWPPGPPYVPAYWGSNGNSSFNPGYFDEPYATDDRYLTAPAAANGVYIYGGALFPIRSHTPHNNWGHPPNRRTSAKKLWARPAARRARPPATGADPAGAADRCRDDPGRPDARGDG